MFRTVLVHKEWGIFLGHCLGLAFWSRLDCAGQHLTPTFNDANDAKDFVDHWMELAETDAGDDSFTFHDIVIEHRTYATVSELREAGLEEHLGELPAAEIDHKRGMH